MKAIILFILFIMLTIPTVFGQIKIGDNPQNIDPASVLELESTSKVLVITRVSTLEMEAITPQRGGIVYNIDTECINYYDGTQWVNLCDAVNFTITNDPIINNRATIEITQTASGYNLEIAKNGILGDNIVDGGIGPDDIQDNSITQDKLAAESVGSSEIRQNAVGSDEIRDGSIAPSDIANFIPGQVLITDENGIVQWGDAGDLMGAVGDEITITGSGTPANPLQITEGIQLNISNNTALIADHIIDDQDTDDTNELVDLTFTKLTNTLSISQSATPVGASVDLSGLVGSDDQQLSLVNNILTLEEGGTPIDLTTYVSSDNQNLGTATLANEQLTITIENGNPTVADLSAMATDAALTAGLALKENIANKSNIETLGNSTVLYPTQNAVKVYVDTEIADIVTSGGSDPVNEQNQTFEVVAGELRITDVAGILSVPITDIDTNTQLTDAEIGAFGYIKTVDEQSLTEILVLNNNANGTTITNLPTPSANSDAATKQYVDDEIAALPAGSDNQQLTLEAGNLLTLTNDATPINLTQFLDNQVANEVEVTAVPINYIASTQDVEAHLAGIDAALLNSGSTEEADGSTITGIGSNADPFKIEPGANGQFLNTTAGVVTWANLPTGIGGTVEADNTTIEGNGSTLNPLQVIDGSITSTQIAAETILSGNIVNGTIGTADIAIGGVETDNILDGTILEIDIADNNVTPDKIEQGGNGEILTTDINGDVIWAALPASLDEQTVDQFLFGAGNLLSISLENDGEIPLTVDLSALEETVAITANTTLINTHITNDGDTDDQNEIELPDDATATSGDVLATDAAGNYSWITPSLTDTDEQTVDQFLFGAGNLLSISLENDGEIPLTVDLSALEETVAITANTTLINTHITNDGDTDDQNEIELPDDATATSGDVLATDAAGNYSWITPSLTDTDEQTVDQFLFGAGNLLSISLENDGEIPLTVDLSALEETVAITANTTLINTHITNDGDTDDQNEIELPDDATATSGDVLATDAAGNYSWITPIIGNNLSNTNLTQTGDRTYDLNDNDLTFDITNSLLSFTGTNSNVGIGNITPQDKLDVDGQIRARGGFASTEGSAGNPGYGFYTNGDTNMGMYRIAADQLGFSTNGLEAMRIDPTQNIATTGNLSVGGTISTTISGQVHPDYVFQKYFLGNSILNPNYDFKELSEIEEFVKANNHLPGIKSAASIKEQGFWDLGEASRINLEKIEELFLHTIEQEKKIKELESSNKNMATEVEALKAQMEEIKKLLLEKTKE